MGSNPLGSVGGMVDNTLGTNMFGENSNVKAADAQTQAANNANATQKYMYDQTRADQEPWRQAGVKALSGIQNQDFMKDWKSQDPGYQFRMDQGANAINNSASARGMSNSGATMKALTQYGQDYASNEYNNAYNRNYGRLSALAGFGNTANSTNANAGANYANQVSQNQIGIGNAQAGSLMGQGQQQGAFVGQLYKNAQTGAGMMGGGGGGGGAMMFSDRRLKTDIQPVDKAELAEMKKHLKAYSFKYTSEEFGEGEWVGVMAQDLEKSKLGRTLVIHDDDGNKQIDLRKVMSLFLATQAEG